MATASLKTPTLSKAFVKMGFSVQHFRTLARSLLPVVCALAGLAVGVYQAQAGTITVSAFDNGTDVTLAWTGSWNITASYGTPASVTGSSNYSQIRGGVGTFELYSYGAATNTAYDATGASITSVFAVGSDIGTATGDSFRLTTINNGNNFTVTLPQGYTFGSTISGTATIPNQTVSGLFGTSLDSGPVTAFSSTLDSVTNNVVFQSVPEPSTYAMLIAGGLAMGGAAIRRRRMARR